MQIQLRTVYTNFWGVNKDTLKTAGTSASEGLIFVSTDYNKKLFLERIAKKYSHQNATAITYSCYTALSVLLTALKNNPEIWAMNIDLETLNQRIKKSQSFKEVIIYLLES